MELTIRDKYLEALKVFEDFVIVSEWAKQVGDLYPELLAKAEQEAANQANETTGLREIAARISSAISTGSYENKIEIDTSERPRKVRFVPEEDRSEHDAQEIEDDVAPLKRDEIIKLAFNVMTVQEKYRISEFEEIAKKLKNYFGLSFEVDHAEALLNPESPGNHHPDNFQLLLKAHNTKKNNGNWKRFTIEEQEEYIQTSVKLQGLVAPRMDIEMDQSVIDLLIERLAKVY